MKTLAEHVPKEISDPTAKSRHLLALDLGAESCRAVVGTLDGDRLSLQEVHRFANDPVEIHGTLYWNFLRLYSGVIEGIRAGRRLFGNSIDGIGIDTWAVDFVLLAQDGSLLSNPVHYRDRRTAGMTELAGRTLSPRRLYELTGMPPFCIATLYQLLAMRTQDSPLLAASAHLQMIPDALAYFLTGSRLCEQSVVSTSLLHDPRRRQWCDEVFRTFDLPRSIMPDLVEPGTVLGELSESVRLATDMKTVPVIAPCTHDTASAMTAVPGEGDDWAFISSGTWSVLGALIDQPNTTDEAFAASLCNEVTCGGFALCKNLVGLWLLHQAREVWQRRDRNYSYDELVDLASKVERSVPLIDPSDPGFLAPKDMVAAIRAYCEKTGQSPPDGPGETSRCIMESLALSYRREMDGLSAVTGRRFRVLNVVGGGSRNRLLCQYTADATGIPVIAGPAEATATGNVLVQALARGYLSSPQEIRDVVRESSTLVEYEPHDASRWEDRYAQYLRLLERTGD